MRKIFLLVCTCYCFAAKGQLNYEFAYPEKELQTNLQLAKMPAEQIRAAGILAIHYKIEFNDSIAAVYINKVLSIAKNTNDINLTATALWWDAVSSASANRYDETKQSIVKANKLLQYAENHHLVKEQISASLLLNGINIHNDLVLSEQYAFNAKQLLDNWQTDSSKKDSVKLEVYQSLAHVFVHKMDGVNAARYLLAQQAYAEQNRNASLKLQAMGNLAAMYAEWPEQTEKAIQWSLKLYEYFKKTKQANNQLQPTIALMGSYLTLGNKDSAAYYLKESERLQDSLKSSNAFLVYQLSSKTYLEIITPTQAIEILDSHFNNRLFLPPALTDLSKASIFFLHANLDSAGFYLAKAKKNKVDSLSKNWNSYNDLVVDYYLKNKEYDKAIALLHEIQKGNEKVGSRYLIESVPKNLYEAYKGKKDYKKADEYLTRYHYLKDSLDDLNNKEKVALMEMQKQKEIQDASLKEQARLQQAEAAKIAFQHKVRLYSLLAGLGILLLVAVMLWRNSINKQKTNALLLQQKNKVEAALSELRSTQAQLIQSEKMASLGELTAGVAHEIQNPLNFVNNFSEVSNEMLDEMKTELASGNHQLATEIADDVKQNLEKILHHGKRADAIVKGMLQHSRSSSGIKEPTDINALCDEYLRLAYHGLRAKDKSFNAEIKTEFDSSIGNVTIIPQDIGRVLLNLYNNAFHTVNEKAMLTANGYQPTAKVTTRKQNGKIEISVIDNGNGIPKNIIDKIFQPFFTTKPTGQGTGLGLSLAYDIVKAHGGELKVETREGKGSEFIIKLPIA